MAFNFTEYAAGIGYHVLSSLLIGLRQCSSQPHVACVSVEQKRLGVVGEGQYWSGGQSASELVKSFLGLLRPLEFGCLLSELM